MSLLQQPPRRVGFASGCQAFGHRELLGVLRASASCSSRSSPRTADAIALVMRLVDYLDKGASLGHGCTLSGRGTSGRCPTPTCSRYQPPGRRRAGCGPGSSRATRSRSCPATIRSLSLRLRHLPARRGLVPDQPAQRGGARTAAARPVRLHVPDLPVGASRRWSSRSRASCRSSRRWSASTLRRRSASAFADWLPRTTRMTRLARRAGRRHRRCSSVPAAPPAPRRE